MWVITYEAIPKPGTEEFGKSGGGFINCWILYAWEDGAKHLARYEVEKEWTIIEEVESSWYESDDIPEEDANRQYYDQALIDGGTFDYNTYPLEADDGDEDFDLDNSSVSSDTKLKSGH